MMFKGQRFPAVWGVSLGDVNQKPSQHFELHVQEQRLLSIISIFASFMCNKSLSLNTYSFHIHINIINIILDIIIMCFWSILF